MLKPFGVADWVQTVRGVGYRFSPPRTAPDRGERRPCGCLPRPRRRAPEAPSAPRPWAPLLVVALHHRWQALQFRRLIRWFDQGSGHPPMLFGALHRFSWRIYRQRRGTRARSRRLATMLRELAARHPSPTGRCGPPGGVGRIVWFNTAGATLLGLQKQDVGQQLASLFRARSCARFLRRRPARHISSFLLPGTGRKFSTCASFPMAMHSSCCLPRTSPPWPGCAPCAKTS